MYSTAAHKAIQKRVEQHHRGRKYRDQEGVLSDLTVRLRSGGYGTMAKASGRPRAESHPPSGRSVDGMLPDEERAEMILGHQPHTDLPRVRVIAMEVTRTFAKGVWGSIFTFSPLFLEVMQIQYKINPRMLGFSSSDYDQMVDKLNEKGLYGIPLEYLFIVFGAMIGIESLLHTVQHCHRDSRESGYTTGHTLAASWFQFVVNITTMVLFIDQIIDNFAEANGLFGASMGYFYIHQMLLPAVKSFDVKHLGRWANQNVDFLLNTTMLSCFIATFCFGAPFWVTGLAASTGLAGGLRAAYFMAEQASKLCQRRRFDKANPVQEWDSQKPGSLDGFSLPPIEDDRGSVGSSGSRSRANSAEGVVAVGRRLPFDPGAGDDKGNSLAPFAKIAMDATVPPAMNPARPDRTPTPPATDGEAFADLQGGTVVGGP